MLNIYKIVGLIVSIITKYEMSHMQQNLVLKLDLIIATQFNRNQNTSFLG